MATNNHATINAVTPVVAVTTSTTSTPSTTTPKAAKASPKATPKAKGGRTLYPPTHVITVLGQPQKPFVGVRAAQWACVRNGVTVAGWHAAQRNNPAVPPSAGLGFLALCAAKGLVRIAAPAPAVASPKGKGKGKGTPASPTSPAPATAPATA